MATKTKPLGRQLHATLEDVTALIIDTNDPARLKELATVRQKLISQISRLVDANLDAADERYSAATAGLRAASRDVKKALKGLESVANAIKKATSAVNLIAKLAA